MALDQQTLVKINEAAPQELANIRADNFGLFLETPPPSPSDEDWKYTPVAVDFDTISLPEISGDPMPPGPFESALDQIEEHPIVVDGMLSTEKSAGGEFWQWGPTLTAASSNGEVLLAPDTDKFAAASATFGGMGVNINIPNGVTAPQPIVVEIQTTQPDTISFPEVSINTGTNAAVEVLILLRSPDGIESVITPTFSIRTGDGSTVSFTVLQLLGKGTTMVSHHRAQLHRDSSLKWGEVGLGGSLARVDLGVNLLGNGCSAEMVGLYYGELNQVLDYQVVIDHRGQSTSSDVLLKGAVEDEAQSVFNGLLRIHEDAVKTSAFETNRNLVLSDGAKANSVPNLEILCDDVICGHGSSVGQLEEEHLYYLMSRGLSKNRAERVLVRGFFEEVIERLPQSEIHDPLREQVDQRFVLAQEQGRLR